MLVRLLLTFLLLCNVGLAHSFDATPVNLVNEALSEVDGVRYPPGVELTTEDSVLFNGYSSIYENGYFRFLTKTNMAEDTQIVLNTTPGGEALYIKRDGKWSKADRDTLVSYIRVSLMPLLKTDLFMKLGGSDKPRVVMVYGLDCNFSRSEELYLDKSKTPRAIFPLAMYGSSAPPTVLCTNAPSLREWAKGKQGSFQYCENKERASKFAREFNRIWGNLGFRNIHFPTAILPNGEILERTEDMSEFNNKLKSL